MIRNILFIAFILTSFLAAPPAHASFFEKAGSYIHSKAGDFAKWWKRGSVGLTKDDSLPGENDNGDTGEETPSDGETPSTITPPGMCRVPQQPPVILCEQGSGFLCVNTPEPGVAGDFIIIKGTIDRRGSTPSGVGVAVQHEYTKKTEIIDTSNYETTDCWKSQLTTRPFCMDEDGFYSAKVPLLSEGPYTISVNATRFSGEPVTKTVRTSRVIAPQMDDSDVTFDPDIRTQGTVNSPYVNVTVSLLGDCLHCDFIGASTSGVTVTVENSMKDSSGSSSSISCSTNIEQGGQARYVLGVPVGPHQNELTVSACNAAAPAGSCPKISRIKFQGPGGISGLKIVNPPPQPSYSSSEYPTIRFEFKIEGLTEDACVNVVLNRQNPVKVCPSSGLYSTELYPQGGINVVTVEYGSESLSTTFPWVFGWGPISSPFSANGEVKDGLVSTSALQVAVPAEAFTNILGPFAGSAVSSDEFAQLIEKFTADGGADGEMEEPSEEQGDLRIPNCEAAALEGFKIKLAGSPSIGQAKIENVSFAKNELGLSINADNASFGISLIKDEDNDGVPDKDPIPLKISFRKAVIDLLLKIDDKKKLILLSSPHTDCDFKDSRYCRYTPAALIPQNMVGDATRFGHFVSCDAQGGDVSDDVREFCNALNSLNAQTGLISEKVLDAVNSALYCGGSKTLTLLARDGIRQDIKIDGGKILGSFTLPAGISIGGVGIDSSGLLLTANLIVGSNLFFSQMPAQLKIPSVGVISAGGKPFLESAKAGDSFLKLAAAADAVNHLFFMLSSLDVERDGAEHGFLDFELSEPFFNKAGFDFVYKCDAFLENEGREGGVPSALCNLRPRVSELLGTPLTKYGYFPANHPMLIRIQGNRALPPHLDVVNESEIPVLDSGSSSGGAYEEPLSDNLLDLQLGGLIVSFYALEVDESVPVDKYGNLTIKLDEDGNPIIRSMRPSDPDPLKGQIASFELALLMAVEIGDVQTNPDDPSEYFIMVRPIADRTRLVISPVPGSNATTIPPASLIAALREKLQYAINIYSSRENAIKIPVSKNISFSAGDGDVFKLLGLKKISFLKDGLKLDMDDGLDVVTLDIIASVTQALHRGGQLFEDTLPH
jgi:hypothetical protein